MNKIATIIFAAAMIVACKTSDIIPLPEHPRPDFERESFVNLNGRWDFTFDATKAEKALSDLCCSEFEEQIMVPFPWGAPLSGVEDKADIAWYGRNIKVPSSWKGKRVFVVVGASDWQTDAWIDGHKLGSHRGGYTPFEFEITDLVRFGEQQNLVFKVDDSYENWHLYGKQGYGNARGIWQTVYMEARGSNFIKSLHFSPDIDNSLVKVDVVLDSEPKEGDEIIINFKNGERESFLAPVTDLKTSFDIPIPQQHLWNLDDPYLYEVCACLERGGKNVDKVNSYFGQRKISAERIPEKDFKYVALNGHPIYLQLCLDQSYHPEGFYTFPSDEFMKNEILISKNLGLNGNRIHIKAEVPRKLYWADKLGLLIMADVPNYWGEPTEQAREEWENCMRAEVERDYNHPSIFSWVDFNETWGLFTKTGDNKEYTVETQEWVRSMYLLTKELDPTRLVEDNSACNNDHVQTDINSWHGYHTGYNWDSVVSRYDSETVVGGSYNYTAGNSIEDVPMINSECGNVWGYKGSTGDCDFSWDYHIMMNAFHRHPKVGGWLYTEHHDVINEWNGYVRFDRSEKFDGLDVLVPGMSIKDFHSPYYLVLGGQELCQDLNCGESLSIPLGTSFTTDANPGKIKAEISFTATDSMGAEKELGSAIELEPAFVPFSFEHVADINFTAPDYDCLCTVRAVLTDESGTVLHRNCCFVRVKGGSTSEGACTFAPSDYSASQWSVKQSSVLGGIKVNGFGHGYFEYTVKLPEFEGELDFASLIFEASAKQLFGKDIDDGTKVEGDFMLGKGTFDPRKNQNSYAMSDTVMWPSKVEVSVNGTAIGTFEMPDDPCDHSGVLSWHAQPRERQMYEAGSHGYLMKAEIPVEAVRSGENAVIRFTVPEDCNGGLAIYGKDFGRYPLDPTIVLKWK